MSTSTQALTPWEQYQALVAKAEAARKELVGRRVKFTGFSGNTDGPTGKVKSLSKNGITVLWDNGTLPEICHPEAVTLLEGQR